MNAMSKHARLTALRGLLRDNPVLFGIAGIGFSVSFQTIAHLARAQHMPGYPVLYPVLIDLGILGFIVEARKAIDDGRSDLVPRLLAWALAGFTVYVNAHGSPARDWLGIALHVVAPCLWVAFLELTRWRRIRRVSAARADWIPRSRWLVSPLRTWGMRRRMVLHNVTSYAEASAREDARMLGMDLAAAVFGKRWKRVAPALLRHHLTAGTLPADVAEAAADGSRELPDRVEAWVSGAQSSAVRAVARARQERRAIEGEPAAPVIAPPKPRQRPRQKRAAPDPGAVAAARDLIRANPRMGTADVVAQSGASKSTVLRIKREARETPRALHPVRDSAGG
jgi:hypothetical protein